jgi:hypothetical protein
MPKERPMLFSASMILALLDDRKKQTRRIVKGAEKFPDIIKFDRSIVDGEPQYKDSGMPVWYSTESDGTTREWGCKFGEVGDYLYVRETWKEALSETHECYAYKADLSYKCGKKAPPDLEQLTALNGGWKPSIHMPKKASRLWLEIVDIRVERLQDISEEDAIAEGIQPAYGKYWLDYQQLKESSEYPVFDNPVDAFRSLWESIHGAGSWDLNVWLWVVEFKKVEQNGH